MSRARRVEYFGGTFWQAAAKSGDRMLRDVQHGETELAVYNLGLLLGDPSPSDFGRIQTLSLEQFFGMVQRAPAATFRSRICRLAPCGRSICFDLNH
jgi:hypothetical protein